MLKNVGTIFASVRWRLIVYTALVGFGDSVYTVKREIYIQMQQKSNHWSGNKFSPIKPWISDTIFNVYNLLILGMI